MMLWWQAEAQRRGGGSRRQEGGSQNSSSGKESLSRRRGYPFRGSGLLRILYMRQQPVKVVDGVGGLVLKGNGESGANPGLYRISDRQQEY